MPESMRENKFKINTTNDQKGTTTVTITYNPAKKNSSPPIYKG